MNPADIGARISQQPAQTVINVWHVDWACTTCRQCGYIEVELAGGPRDKNRKPQPKTTDEEFYRKMWEAHRTKSATCVAAAGHLLCGRMWRWERHQTGRRMVMLETEGAPAQTEYKWPPWQGDKGYR